MKRVGRSDSYATEYDLEAEEYVPIPKGDVTRRKKSFKMLLFMIWIWPMLNHREDMISFLSCLKLTDQRRLKSQKN